MAKRTTTTTTTSTTASTASTTPYIPLDLLTTILIRLPSKTLLKFLTVSKSWLSLITNPNFISSHLHHHKSLSLHHLFLHEPPSAYSLFHYGHPFNHRTFLPTPPSEFKSVAASFNGLICLFNPKNRNICLWNPSINKFLNIQRVPKLHHFETFTVIGVGFDDCNNDYKVAAIDYNRRIVNNGEDLRPYVQVYSINGGVRLGWRRVLIPDIFKCCDVSHLSDACFAGNLVNWIVNVNYNEVMSGVSKYVGWILTFDSRNDCFGAMELPKLLNEVVEPELSLAVFDESLAVIHLCGDDGGYCAIVWKMDGGAGGGGEESFSLWRVLYRISLPCLCGMNPNLWDEEEGKVFIATSSGTLIVFNVKSGGSETSSCFDGEVALIGGYSGQAFGYTESLVLLDRFCGSASWSRKDQVQQQQHAITQC